MDQSSVYLMNLYHVVFILVYSLIDSIPASFPYPLSLIPPKGAIGDINL